MAFFENVKSQFILNFIDDNRWRYLWDGLIVTLKITFVALILGVVLGSIIAIVRATWDKNAEEMKPGVVLGSIIAIVRATWDKNAEEMKPGVGRAVLKFFNALCNLYLTVIRGTPVVVQLMIIYYIIFRNSNNGVAVAMLAFGLNSAAYVAEIVRGGILSIDKGQFEAGRSLGFNYVQTMGNIILPQAVKNVLPSLVNEFITLLKETSVAGYVAVQDLTRGGDIIRGRTYSPFMPLIAVALIYLVIVIVLTKLLGALEKKLRSKDH